MKLDNKFKWRKTQIQKNFFLFRKYFILFSPSLSDAFP